LVVFAEKFDFFVWMSATVRHTWLKLVWSNSLYL